MTKTTTAERLMRASWVVALAFALGSCSAGDRTPLPTVQALETPPRLASPYAINYPWWARMDATASQVMTEKASAAGLGWIRLYLPWGQIERSPNQFDWGDYGLAIENAYASGLAVEAVLVHPTPCWAVASCIQQTPSGPVARCDERENGCRPASATTFQRFANAAARRFGNRVAAWAIWQEPNAPEQWEGSDRREAAREYQRLILIPGYHGIKTWLPNAKITAPGVVSWDECLNHDIDSIHVTPLPDPWIVDIESQGARSLVVPLDAITIHRYGTAVQINQAMDCIEKKTRWKVQPGGWLPLCRNGNCPKFWLEEFGAIVDSCDAPKEEAMQTAIGVWEYPNPTFERRFLWLLQGVPANDCGHNALCHNDLAPIGDKYCTLKRYLHAKNGEPMSGDAECSATASCGFMNCPAGKICGGGVCLTGLSSEQVLSSGQAILSSDKRFMLIMQTDGNLVLGWAVPPGGVLWSSGTVGHPNSFAKMQADGNLIVGSNSDGVTWSPYTHGHPGAFLVVQNDGNLVIYSAGWDVLWQAGTGGIE